MFEAADKEKQFDETVKEIKKEIKKND